MPVTTTTFDAMLKEFYVDKIAEEINQNTKLLDYFKKRDDLPTDGRRVVYPAHTGRNSGVGAVAEGGTLPTAGNQSYADYQIPFRYNYGRIQLTAQTIKQSQTSKGAFRKAVDEEITRTARDVGRDRNRQLFGWGRGDLCLVNGAVSGATTVTVDAPGGFAGSINGNRFLKVGDNIAFSADGTTIEDADSVATVNANGLSFTTTNNVTVSDNAIIVRASTDSITAASGTGLSNEVMGLSGMVDDGTLVATYHNQSRSGASVFDAWLVNLGDVLSLNAIQKAWDATEQRGNGSIKTLFAHHSVRREYLSLLQTFRRYVNERALRPDGGFAGAALDKDIEYAEKPMKVDRDAPYRRIFGIDDTFMFRYVVTEGEWADDDGRILLRIANGDSYEARYRVFDNFQCDCPNTTFLIHSITMSEDEEIIQAV